MQTSAAFSAMRHAASMEPPDEIWQKSMRPANLGQSLISPILSS